MYIYIYIYIYPRLKTVEPMMRRINLAILCLYQYTLRNGCVRIMDVIWWHYTLIHWTKHMWGGKKTPYKFAIRFFTLSFFFFLIVLQALGIPSYFRQTWRGSYTCDSNQEITSSVSMISGWWCLKLVFGLMLLSFLLSFCYRFVSRTFSQSMSAGHTTTWSVHAMLEAYQQLHFHSEITRNTMQ